MPTVAARPALAACATVMLLTTFISISPQASALPGECTVDAEATSNSPESSMRGSAESCFSPEKDSEGEQGDEQHEGEGQAQPEDTSKSKPGNQGEYSTSKDCTDTSGVVDTDCAAELADEEIPYCGGAAQRWVLYNRGTCLDSQEASEPEPTQNERQNDPAPATIARAEFVDMFIDPAEVKFEEDLLGFGYKDRHTNMYADVETQTTSGDVLDAEMELRAIPVAYHWDYGDGTTRTTYEPGSPLPDYDGKGNEINKMDFATETSHVYEETGIYSVSLVTEFIGQFRYDDGEWTGISGTITSESSPGEADIWTQNSRWVSGACESTDQWGCNGPIEFDPSTDRPPKIYQDQYDENGNWLGPVE